LPASSAGSNGSFFVGFTDDLVKNQGAVAVPAADALGGKAFRITLMWQPGQTQPDPNEVGDLNRATGAGADRLVLAVYSALGSSAPLDSAGRDAYCGYVKNVLARWTSFRNVVIWNEPNKRLFWNPQANAPALYELLLARCYDVLHNAFGSRVNVIGLSLSSTGNDDSVSTSPGAFIRGVGDAYRSSGRSKRLLDTVGFHPYAATTSERPWRKHIQSKTIGEGDWNKLAYNLWLAFNGTGQPAPGTIWYLEAGFQTALDPGKEPLYTGTENVATLPDWAGGEPDSPAPDESSAAPDQATQVLDAIRLASCQPGVKAYFNFLLADEPRLSGWQSGAYWTDLTPKDSFGAFQAAIAAANAGTVDCAALKGGLPSGDFMPPGAPPGLAGASVASPVSIVLTWSSPSDDTASYRVFRNNALVATVSSPGWTDTGVAGGASYTYAVRALDVAGNLGDASSVVVAADFSPPAAPVSLGAAWVGGPSRVELSWPAAIDDVGVVSYEVSRDGQVLGTTPSLAFTDTAIAPAATYTYSVVAIDAGGNRSAPVSAPVTTPSDLAPPSRPGKLSVKAVSGPRRVNLSWSASTDDVGVTGYRVYRDGAVIATVGTPGYTDSTVAARTKYRYSVSAADAVGNESELSSTVSVKTTR
jgi:chitodextrinase